MQNEANISFSFNAVKNQKAGIRLYYSDRFLFCFANLSLSRLQSLRERNAQHFLGPVRTSTISSRCDAKKLSD